MASHLGGATKDRGRENTQVGREGGEIGRRENTQVGREGGGDRRERGRDRSLSTIASPSVCSLCVYIM